MLDNFLTHKSTNKGQRVGEWAEANNVELAYTPHYASWLNRVEARFQALRYFCVDGADHPSHAEQAAIICRYIRWRNRLVAAAEHDARCPERLQWRAVAAALGHR